MKRILVIFTILASNVSFGQYLFTGQVDADQWQNTAYLSIIEDYRKLSGVYSEQIIAKAEADSLGYFKFSGNQLDAKNRIYRIHVDNCEATEKNSNHFNGHCDNSKEIIFVAKNTDTISFPLSFDKQMFCDVSSSNPKALSIVKVDSIKEEMRFAYSEIRSEANKKLNNKKWFKTLQQFGTHLDEPLAELYIYTFLSDRSSDLHDYYLSDLKSNSYYDDLQDRLATQYSESTYFKQYTDELNSDRYVLNDNSNSESFNWNYFAYGLLVLSLLVNAFFIIKKKQQKSNATKNLKAKLTKQEQNVLDFILDNKTNKEIAEGMFVSVSTVKTHTNNIYRKLNVQSRDEAKSLFTK